MAYATVEDVQEYVGITDATSAILFDSLLKRAQKKIETHTGKIFEATADTTQSFDARFDVDGLLLDWTPYNLWLAQITSITNGDGTTVTTSQYVTEPRHAAPYFGIRLLASADIAWEIPSDGDTENAIAITGRWAYSVEPPADITQACVLLALAYYNRRNGVGIKSISTSGMGSITFSDVDGIPGEVADILEPYVRTV